MTIILVTQDVGASCHRPATSIATSLGLDLVSHEQLEQLVAGRLQIDHGHLHRLIAGDAPVIERWLVGRHRLAQCFGGCDCRTGRARRRGGRNLGRAWFLACNQACAVRARLQRYDHCRGGDGIRRSRPDYVSERLVAFVDPAMVRGPPAAARAVRCPPRHGACTAWPNASSRCGSLHEATNSEQPHLHEQRSASFVRSWRHAPIGASADSALAVLEVEVGRERVALLGDDSKEQAIARIEDHLHGKGASRYHKWSVPPGICSL